MDIAITLTNTGLGAPPEFDLLLDGPDLATDEGLQTAVIISLFTDRRAEDDDEIPDGGRDRRGWWGDEFLPDQGDRIGSRLWLLSREKQLSEVLERAREYAEEALAWLLEDGIASRVSVTAEQISRGVLGLGIQLQKPDSSLVEYRFNTLWEAL